MLPSASIDELTHRMRERRGSELGVGGRPYLLFLGEGCGHAAGVPPRATIARQAIRMLDAKAQTDGMSDDAVFDRFGELAASLSPSQVSRLLRTVFEQIAVPSFYQDLALLIRERFFPLVLTMNYDTLLEQALVNAGVRTSEFLVTTFSEHGLIRDTRTTRSGPPLVNLIKLHGDLARGTVYLGPEQIDLALSACRSWIKADMTGDIIMVAHQPSDDPVDRWLAHSPQRELWWVNENPPTDPARLAAWTQQPLYEVTGEVGRPQRFFTQLALRLSGGEELATTPEPAPSLPAMRGPRLRGPAPAQPPPAPPMDEALQNLILRSQAVLYNLDRTGIAGERPPQLQAQIAYEKKQISRLEDRIRADPAVQRHVLDCVKRIRERVSSVSIANFNPDTRQQLRQFLDGQIAVLERELTPNQSPNPFLVSGALGATLTVADRLLTEYGGDLIDPTDVRSLAAYAPSAASKVVL